MNVRIACLVPALALLLTATAGEAAGDRGPASGPPKAVAAGAMAVRSTPPLLIAQLRGCKAVSSCRQAVEMWCGGYARADGDGDGIPCESVCRSLREVNRLRAEIGC